MLVALAAGAWYFLAPPKDATAMPGSIEGTTNYPSDYIPVQIVCAEPVDGGSEYCTETPAGDDELLTPSWSIEVPAGEYYISARVKDPSEMGSDLGDYRAYYTQYVMCGLNVECTDHTKIPVTVTSGQATLGITPYDWYIR